MTCQEYHNRLSRYMDGELSRWRRWKIENHLRHCGACSEMLRELEGVDHALSALREPSAPPYLAEAVMFRLPAMPPARRRPGGMLPWAAGLAVAGMQATVLLGAYWSGFAHGSSSTPRRDAAAIGASSTFIGGNTPIHGLVTGGQPAGAEPRAIFPMPLFGRPASALTSMESTPITNAASVRRMTETGRIARLGHRPGFQPQGAH